MKKTNKQKGITLVALVITIIILLILAAISIQALTNTGLFRKAEESKETTIKAQLKEEIEMAIQEIQSEEIPKENTVTLESLANGQLVSKLKDITAELGINEITGEYKDHGYTIDSNLKVDIGEGLEEYKTISNYTDTYKITSDYTDAYGNVAKIPEGFQVSTKQGQTNINEGLVVRNATDKSEFVWIPVGKIYTDIARTEENAKTIDLNRYIFDKNGNPTARNYEDIETYYREFDNSTLGNATAKANSVFKTSVTTNGGYYIGRYEARTATERSAKTDALTTLTTKASEYVYNYVTQIQAADLARNMYGSEMPFTSDLMNSYAWDTATLFLQTCGTNSKYSRQIGINSSLATTGTNDTTKYTGTQDVQCNVYDMASNCFEWTTETCRIPDFPCVHRGGWINERLLHG